MLFGKNSDRQRNEAQAVEFSRSGVFAPGVVLNCTYIAIAQAERTYATLLCRPFWSWGAEMGANEWGVVIGNEGLHSRGELPQREALTGMDLVRLGLERARTADEAVEVITGLLELYGQGGNCGHLTPAFYQNGFMIADPDNAFVLETIDREWVLERVSGRRSMSNRYSVARGQPSQGMRDKLKESGWDCHGSIAETIAAPDREHIGHAQLRQGRSDDLLRAGPDLDIASFFEILRDHGSTTGEDDWTPRAQATRTLCMHAGSTRQNGQTTGSMVSDLRSDRSVHWLTGTSAPCLSIFKPVLCDAFPPTERSRPTDRYDPASLWWAHERFHRAAVSGDFASIVKQIRSEQASVEATFRARIDEVLNGGSAADRLKVVRDCWQRAAEVETRWFNALGSACKDGATDFDATWTGYNRKAGVPEARSAECGISTGSSATDSEAFRASDTPITSMLSAGGSRHDD